MSTPPVVRNRTWRRPRHMAVASEAAISTARSNDSPWWVDGPGVEQDRGAGLPRHLVLAEHELAGAGRRAPVDPAQVVADLVLPQAEEVEPDRHPGGLPGAHPGLPAGGAGHGQHVLHPG